MKKVLIVEDSKFQQNLYKSVLRNEGYYIECVCTIKDAIIKAATTTYDLYIVDILLSDAVSGINLIDVDTMRPMLVVTALLLEDMATVEYIQKPISKDRLVHTVRKLLNK